MFSLIRERAALFLNISLNVHWNARDSKPHSPDSAEAGRGGIGSSCRASARTSKSQGSGPSAQVVSTCKTSESEDVKFVTKLTASIRLHRLPKANAADIEERHVLFALSQQTDEREDILRLSAPPFPWRRLSADIAYIANIWICGLLVVDRVLALSGWIG